MRSEEISIEKIAGFWESYNFPPFVINEDIKISLSISEQNFSLVTIKEKSTITNYALNFLEILRIPSGDSFEIHFIIRNGDNILEEQIGEIFILKCRMFSENNDRSEIVCQLLSFRELLFVKQN